MRRGSHPHADEETYRKLQSKLRFKYVLDRIFAVILLILSSPIFLFVAFLIKWDGFRRPQNAGPVFYTEPRISAGELFRIVKFRTVPQTIVRQIQKQPDSKSITASTDNTWAGRLILKWYLDELPQLVNIMKGEMSFVGPRPHILKHHKEEVRKGLRYRDYLKGGLLGVPQACKRHPKYRALFERMARTHRSNIDALNALDGLYAKKCLESSLPVILWFDLSLIFKGLIVVFRGSSLK